MLKFLLCASFFGWVSSQKIIIIGAGPAGIAAASRLLDNNITDFRILEAENRIGGRIHSVYINDAFVDFGAQYVHGVKNNLVYNLAKDYIKPGKEINNSLMYYSGNLKTGEGLLKDFLNVYYEIAEDSRFRDLSLGEAFLKRYNETVLKTYENDTEMLTYAKCFIRTSECFVLSLEGAFRWFEPSTFSNFQDCEGDQTQSWNGLGYKTILDILLKNFPEKTGYNIDKQLSLGKTVSKIMLNGDSIKVKCKDGSEHISEHVIFTPSLGVLKHDHENIFEPSLSEEKKTAIENLGFDGVMKVIIEFPNKWWGDEKNYIFVWSEEERKNLVNEFPHGPIKDGDHWLSWFYTVGVTPKNPNVLMGWIVGPMLPEIERMDYEEMGKGIIFVVRKFLGKEFNVTDPTKVTRTKWCTNPNFRGSYSFETMSMRRKNITSARNTLLKPVTGTDGTPRILFAGEATNPRRFATVDGAIETGFREGDRLVEILKNK